MQSTRTGGPLRDFPPVSPRRTIRPQGACVGMLTAVDAVHGLQVSYPGQPEGEPVPARSTVPITPGDQGRSVLLVFEGNDPQRPIITGLILEQPVALPATEAVATLTLPETRVDHVRVKGRRISFEGSEAIVLQCGKSSITLHANGRMVLRGQEIVSRASGSNKVKGAVVLIN